LLQLKMSALHDNIADNPWIESVSVKRVFPEELVVTVQEKQAYFWVQHGDRLYYADQKGRRITRISPDRFVSLPVLYMQGEGLKSELSMLVNHLEDMSFPFSFQDIAWINIKPAGSIEMRIQSLGMDILMDEQVLRQGPERLNRIWKDLKKRNETKQVERIILLGNNAWVGFKG
ncbi:MAG: cell division protein FtsQ/DivIB, partial [Desulfonatronovibrionaceae bacterium]